nr:MAG TPA: hypothetical protein [Caudoviricetes sp.]
MITQVDNNINNFGISSHGFKAPFLLYLCEYYNTNVPKKKHFYIFFSFKC